MTEKPNGTFSRRGVLAAFAATAAAAAPTYSSAAGFLRGGGDVRRLRMYSGRTGERIDMIYWIDGNYIRDAVEEINLFMRDWRSNDVKAIDLRTLDILAAAHNMMDTSEPYMLISGYRSPQTNAMLRSRGSGVAKNSRHLRGEAADVRLNSRSVSQLSRAALACKGGGVGRYTGSNFVHMDCGPVRSWGS
ncbi:YcbK family protein [Rhodosalinus sp. K401]|uniref:YcbK family protein n=1 Tax=Rhodosalinus sp. K401 TaxID=3239195 RepID=UPI0035242C1D